MFVFDWGMLTLCVQQQTDDWEWIEWLCMIIKPKCNSSLILEHFYVNNQNIIEIGSVYGARMVELDHCLRFGKS